MVRTVWMAAALAFVLLPGTVTTSLPAPTADPPVPEWARPYLEGGELGFTAPTGEAYRVHLELSSYLPADPEEVSGDTTVVLRGADGGISAAMVVTEEGPRILANTAEGSHRYRADGGAGHSDDRRDLQDVTWQGRPL